MALLLVFFGKAGLITQKPEKYYICIIVGGFEFYFAKF